MNASSSQLYAGLADASRRLEAGPGAVEPARFADVEAAVGWVSEHRAALMAEIGGAVAAGRPKDAVDLVGKLLSFLLRAKEPDVAVGLAQDCLDAARTAGDRHAEGLALLHLADCWVEGPKAEDTVEPLRAAVAILTECEDTRQAASARLSLGIALSRGDTCEEAEGILAEVLETYAALGDPLRVAVARYYRARNLNTIRPEQAVVVARQAADNFAELGIRAREGSALLVLGIAYWKAGRSGDAIPALRRAIDICVETGSTQAESSALRTLGLVVNGTGDAKAARKIFQRAAERAVACRDLGGAANANYRLAETLMAQKRYGKAIPYLRLSVEQATEAGCDDGAASLLLGTAYRMARLPDEAVTAFRSALMALPRDNPRLWASANARLGKTLEESARFSESLEPLREAAAAFGQIGEAGKQADLLALAEAAQKRSEAFAARPRSRWRS